jgi:hypothetical protein
MGRSIRDGDLRALGRAVWRLGVRGPRRRLFWSLVARALRRGPDLLPRAVMFAIVGESLIRYTEEVVLPRIDATLAALDDGLRPRPAGAAPLAARPAPTPPAFAHPVPHA